MPVLIPWGFSFVFNLLVHTALFLLICLPFSCLVSLLEIMVQLKSLYWLIKYLASFLAKEQEGNLHLNKIWMSAEDS